MTFEEIKYLLNENSTIRIYNSNHDFYAEYDGHESIPECFDYAEVNDIFADEVENFPYLRPAIGIELDF